MKVLKTVLATAVSIATLRLFPPAENSKMVAAHVSFPKRCQNTQSNRLEKYLFCFYSFYYYTFSVRVNNLLIKTL